MANTKPNQENQVQIPHYKDVKGLMNYLDGRGRVLPRSKSGLTAKQQRQVIVQIKRARQLALLPFTQTLR